MTNTSHRCDLCLMQIAMAQAHKLLKQAKGEASASTSGQLSGPLSIFNTPALGGVRLSANNSALVDTVEQHLKKYDGLPQKLEQNQRAKQNLVRFLYRKTNTEQAEQAINSIVHAYIEDISVEKVHANQQSKLQEYLRDDPVGVKKIPLHDANYWLKPVETVEPTTGNG